MILSNIIFQLTDPDGALTEAKRVTKQNGRICVVEWADKFDEGKMKELFEKNGLTFERRFDAGERHYGMIFRK